jgi:hypothetical protein
MWTECVWLWTRYWTFRFQIGRVISLAKRPSVSQRLFHEVRWGYYNLHKPFKTSNILLTGLAYTFSCWCKCVQNGPPNLPSNGYQGSFPGLKRPGREADHSPPSTAEVKERMELYLNSPNTPSWRGAYLSTGLAYTFSCWCKFCCGKIKINFFFFFLPLNVQYHWQILNSFTSISPPFMSWLFVSLLFMPRSNI